MARLAAAFILVMAGAAPAAYGADLTVRISGLENSKGSLALCLWSDAKNYPDCGKSPSVQRRTVAAAAARRPITFSGLKPGTYAVSVIHDENGDGRLNTNVLGIPSEGYGVSNNALPRFSAPRFKPSAFRVKGDTVQTIRLRYF